MSLSRGRVRSQASCFGEGGAGVPSPTEDGAAPPAPLVRAVARTWTASYAAGSASVGLSRYPEEATLAQPPPQRHGILATGYPPRLQVSEAGIESGGTGCPAGSSGKLSARAKLRTLERPARAGAGYGAVSRHRTGGGGRRWMVADGTVKGPT